VRENPPDPKSDQLLVSLVYGSKVESWSLAHSLLVNRVPTNMFNGRSTSRIRVAEVYAADFPEIYQGQIPKSLRTATVVLVDPEANFFPALVNALKESFPRLEVSYIHSRVSAISLSGQQAF
jgi:hypothetical protein